MILQHLSPNLGGSWAQSSFQCFVTITRGLEPMHHLTVDSVLNRKDYSFRLPVDRFCSSYHKTTRIREAPKKRQTALSIINTLICRLYLFFLLCERNHTFLTSHRLPWNQFSHATLKILQLIHLFSYTIRILLQGFMAMSCTRVSHYFLSPNYIAHHLTLSTETKSDFLLNVSARWHCLGFHYIFKAFLVITFS